MHLIELRSGREGHPTYRAVAQAMHERIAAIHPGGRGGDEPRRHLPGAAPGADPERDPHPPQAGSGGRAGRGARRASTRSAELSRAACACFGGPSPSLGVALPAAPASARARLAGERVRSSSRFCGGFLARASARARFAGCPGRRAAAGDPAEEEQAEVDEPEQRELEEEEGDDAERHPERAPEAGQQAGPHRLQAGVDAARRRSRSGRRGRSRRRAGAAALR